MANEKKDFKRFGLNQRIQHGLLLVTFALQVITGFPLSYPEKWWAKGIVSMLGGWEMRSDIHHISGIVMVLLGTYHVAIYAVRPRRSKILPGFKDVSDFFQYIKQLIGLSGPPAYGRYTWKEKFEYIGVVWGTVLMGITGLILLYPFIAMEIMPVSWVHLSRIIHFYEAILATLVIIVWHFYNVHFHPHFGFQKSIFNGKISMKQMEEDHPLELLEHAEKKKKGKKIKAKKKSAVKRQGV